MSTDFQDHAADRYIEHQDPVWRSKANWIQHVRVDIGLEKCLEQLWLNKANFEMEVCCVPFFLYDVALGDVVEIDEQCSLRVLRPSGRFVFRLRVNPTGRDTSNLVRQIERAGGLCEPYSRHFLAVDAADQETANRLSNYFEEIHQMGLVEWEPGGEWINRDDQT